MDEKKSCANSFLIESIFLLVLGILILILPQITTVAIALLIGIALMLGGLYRLINALKNRDGIKNTLLSTIIGIFMIGIGMYLSVEPFFSLLILTIAVGLFFILEGVASIIIALKSKNIIKNWWVAIVAAIAQFILAAIIISGLPSTAFFTLGILIGVNLIFVGIAMLSIYSALSKNQTE